MDAYSKNYTYFCRRKVNNVCTVFKEKISYLHPLEYGGESLPEAFTYPFRYTPHPLCRRAALIVQEKLKEMGIEEGKMYGVLVVKAQPQNPFLSGARPLGAMRSLTLQEPVAFPVKEGSGLSGLYFLAAYSGQLNGSYNHPWFVPPVVDYLDPESHFQREQAEIVELGRRMEAMRSSGERKEWQQRVTLLRADRDEAVKEAKRVYDEGKIAIPQPLPMEREIICSEMGQGLESLPLRGDLEGASYIRLRQFQKANIQRAKKLYKEEIAELEGRLAALNEKIYELSEERKRRSEALQQWLFEQFVFLNGRGERKGLVEIWKTSEAGLSPSRGKRGLIPSGAGECCAPKLLQAAYQLGLEPLAMAEFWWGTSKAGHYREPGAFFPACRSKCYPILGHMLQGLNVEPDPARHYENRELEPIKVLWEDEHLAVVYKPEGWCSIPGKSDQPNLLDECFRLWPEISGSVIVHRLDQDTSGVMVIAKNALVHRALGQQFEQREVKKRYVALLEGTLTVTHGEICLPLGPDLENMPHQQVDFDNGKEAVTRFEVVAVEQSGNVTRVFFYPQTGRTHQLRVHSAAPEGLNAPIVGDRLYGHVADRLYLHAESIKFVHPLTKEEMHFCLPAPF